MEQGGLTTITLGLLILLGIIPVILWIWSLIHCATNKRLSDTNRLVGILLIVCLSVLGSLIYLFIPRDATPILPHSHV